MTTLAEAQAAGFLLGGEPLALDLANTLVDAGDLLDGRHEAFWQLQAGRLPAGWGVPAPTAVKALRSAVKDLVAARLAGEEPPAPALALVNQEAAAAAVSQRLAPGWRQEQAWQAPDGAALALAAVASSAIALLAGPQAARLRRCAHEACSLVFVATDERRKWCAPNLCGNRTRVARHYQRHR